MLLAAAVLAVLTACSGTPTTTKQAQQVTEVSEVEVTQPVESTTPEPTEQLQPEQQPTAAPEQTHFLVAIDPGHQAWDIDMSAKEPNGPGSSTWKAKATTGTAGRFSGLAEYELNLQVALLLRDELEQMGFQTLLVRENNETAISNAERAQKANEAGADIYVRIHANGSENASTSGALMLVPSAQNPYVGALAQQSKALADCILTAYCAETGFANDGVQCNDTMTGINWSKVPVALIEMGFMTNAQDDMAMAQPEFQKKMAKGIAEGIHAYYEQIQ